MRQWPRCFSSTGARGSPAQIHRLAPEAAESAHPPPEELARDLEKLGATFIKLGQLLSTRADLLPPPYLEALARLQDDVVPFPFEDVQQTIEEELGVRLSKAFSHFEDQPIAAASLGQVHKAVLRDGRIVAVKVQRPDIAEQIRIDLEALQQVAQFLDRHSDAGHRYNIRGVVEEFREALVSELDYRREATNMWLIRSNLQEFEKIVVPAPTDDYTTAKVLTMEYIRGMKVTALSPLTRLESTLPRWRIRSFEPTSSRSSSTACSMRIRTQVMSLSPTTIESRSSMLA